MYLSRLTLDPASCNRELGDVRAMHGLVMAGFPDGVGRVLWRQTNERLYIQSGDAPDWSPLAGRLSAEQKQVALPNSQGRYSFQLVYSPTYKAQGRRRCVRQEERAAHLKRLLATRGMRLLEVSLPYGEELRGSGGEIVVRVNAVGTLEVDDPEGFGLALRQGLGSHKAYGCGLLTAYRLN